MRGEEGAEKTKQLRSGKVTGKVGQRMIFITLTPLCLQQYL